MLKRWTMAFLLMAAPVLAEEGERVPPLANEPAKKECGACHMAYQPQLLPAESWRKVFADLAHHFGENASLDDRLRQEILDDYVTHAGRPTEAAAPLRITEQRWWLSEHRRVPEKDWTKAKFKGNCSACHQQAEQGNYEKGD